MLIDVHAHLDFEEFDNDREYIISNCKEQGVSRIICNGVGPQSNQKTLEISKEYDIVQAALGMYPVDAEKISLNQVQEEIDFIRQHRDRVVALGEIGLDLKHGKDIEKQKRVLKMFLDLSKELDVPVIIHSRKAEEQCIDFIEQEGVRKVVMHCFSGKKRLVRRIIDLGWYFSIPATVTRAHQFQLIVELCPVNKLLTETDSPYLTPSRKPERNDPSNVRLGIETIAKLKGLDKDETKTIIFANYQRLF